MRRPGELPFDRKSAERLLVSGGFFCLDLFGQNFGWMVGRIRSWPVFVGLGIGTELVALAFLLAFFKRNGWF